MTAVLDVVPPAGSLVTLPEPPRHDPEAVLLPHNLEAERTCLGAAIMYADSADYLADQLQPEDFFRRSHREIFQAIRRLRHAKGAVDFVTLKTELARVGKLEEVGGAAALSSLADGMPRSANVPYYAGILKDLQVKRALVGFATRTIDHVAEGSHGSTSILHDADRRLMELTRGHVGGRMRSLSDTATERFNELEWRHSHKGELRGVDTGYPSINELTLGWRPGDLIIIAARTSIGKTSLVLNSMVHGARTVRAGTEVRRRFACFSLEMRRQQLEDRILAQLSQVELTRIQSGHLVGPDFAALTPALEEMRELRIEIDDRAGQTAIEMRAACRRMQADGGIDGVVVDYIQLMPGTLERKGATRTEELTDIARRLKDLSDELSCPVIVLSQLKRSDGRPQIADLKECGSLEQFADIVGLLHRKDHRVSGPTEFILGKQRNGPTGTVTLAINRDTTTFTDAGPEEAPAEEDEKPRRRAPRRRNS